MADEPFPGNLGFTAHGILTHVSLLMPTFSLVYCPHVLTVMLQPVYEAPLPIITDSVASVVSFSPGNFRRRITRPVSYYALFK